jgi:hypothetical protein
MQYFYEISQKKPEHMLSKNLKNLELIGNKEISSDYWK